jgi:predicted GIY-YIG superfamily endonuclease
MTPLDTSHTWEPDPETGLSGEQYLTEAFEDHVTDLSAAHEPGVYILELSTPATTDYDTYARLWLDEFETTPEYLTSIAATGTLHYVGAASDVYERLDEHLTSPNRSTAVATVFPIHSIRYIHWFETADEAFQNEHRIAMDLSNRIDAHVHTR